MIKSIFKSDRQAIYIAEIGLNHNGDMDVARKMISSAAGAGADAVKFQVFVPELMISVYTSDLLTYGVEKKVDRGQIDFFKRFVFKSDEYRELKLFAERLGILFFASVFDLQSIYMLEELDVSLYKMASSEVTNHPLIEAVAKTGKPMILSTGISTEEEIAMAVRLFQDKSSALLVLMHCVSLYPPLPEYLNISRIMALKERFNLEVGFSDHTNETVASILAAGYGARIFEKHFTIDRFYDCPDKDISLTPDEFQKMVDYVEKALRMNGSGAISSGSSEEDTARAARRSLFARRFIPRGKVIEEDDLIALRPGVGIPVYRMKEIAGKTSKVDIKKDFLIKKEYFD